MRRLCLALVLALVSLGAAGAQPPERARLHEVELGNGLQVLGYRDDSTSLVGVFLAVKVGAKWQLTYGSEYGADMKEGQVYDIGSITLKEEGK